MPSIPLWRDSKGDLLFVPVHLDFLPPRAFADFVKNHQKTFADFVKSGIIFLGGSAYGFYEENI